MVVNNEDDDIVIFLRLMSKTGFFYTLKLIIKNNVLSINEIEDKLKQSFGNKVSAKIILNGLENLGLIKKSQESRIEYAPTFIGEKIFSLLNQIKEII